MTGRSPEQQPEISPINRILHRILFDRHKETQRSIFYRYPELGKIPEDGWPKNVLIIPDGNGRWAQANKLAVQAGHEKGSKVIVQAFREFSELSEHIPFVGAWGFSVDNLKRSDDEVSYLMNLFERTIELLRPELQQRNNKFIHIGRRDILERRPSLREIIERTERETQNNTGQTLYIALGFGGEDQELRMMEKARQLSPEVELTPEIVASFRDGEGLIPPADLIIRTSGEHRVSDVGWLAGRNTELDFIDKLFPSVTMKHFVESLVRFSKRERRMGSRPSVNGAEQITS